MPEGKVEPYANGALALLHDLAGHIVYCCYVIGIDRMAQSQAISKQRSPKRHREAPEARQRPNPDQNIKHREQRINAEQATPKADLPLKIPSVEPAMASLFIVDRLGRKSERQRGSELADRLSGDPGPHPDDQQRCRQLQPERPHAVQPPQHAASDLCGHNPYRHERKRKAEAERQNGHETQDHAPGGQRREQNGQRGRIRQIPPLCSALLVTKAAGVRLSPNPGDGHVGAPAVTMPDNSLEIVMGMVRNIAVVVLMIICRGVACASA